MKKLTKGFTLVELLVVIGILGILMGALFPAINGAMLSAKTNAMAMSGRNLFNGIMQANIDRLQSNRESLWPKKNSATTSDGSDDIAEKTWNDADSYFDELFGMASYGTSDWDNDKWVDVDIKHVSGPGVPTYKGNKTLKGCVAWKVVTDLTDDMPDVLPVLVSRNLDTSTFAVSGEKNTIGETKRLTMGKDFAEPFGSKACVIIHKGGGATVHKARYATLADIYEKQTISFPSSVQISYLEPSKSN